LEEQLGPRKEKTIGGRGGERAGRGPRRWAGLATGRGGVANQLEASVWVVREWCMEFKTGKGRAGEGCRRPRR